MTPRTRAFEILFVATLTGAGGSGCQRDAAASDDREVPAERYPSDRDEMTWMKSARPDAAEKLERGESLLRNGSTAELERAAELFASASRAAPESALAARRQCEALSRLGKHDAAVAACDAALARGGKVLDLRAAAAALMSGSRAPTSTEVGRALFYARRAIDILPNAPWGYAARCDVAHKLGDIEMLNQCTAELIRVAPAHYETRRATARRDAARPGVGVLIGWLLTAFAALGTLGHALRRAWKRSMPAHAVAGALVAALALSATPTRADGDARPAIAGHLSKYPIDGTNPESSVPTPAMRDKDPLEYGYFLMDLGDAADRATARGDRLAAARFYRALIKAVPDAAVGYRKACEAYEAAGELAEAKRFCAAALTQSDVQLPDYSHYARVVFAQKPDVPKEDIGNIDAVVSHLKPVKASQTVAWDIECNLGVRLADVARLKDCTAAWARLQPNEPKVLFYQWVLALHQKDYSAARALVARARTTSMDPKELRSMEEATQNALPFWRKAFADPGRARLGGVILGAALLAGLALLLLRRRSPTAPQRQVTPTL